MLGGTVVSAKYEEIPVVVMEMMNMAKVSTNAAANRIAVPEFTLSELRRDSLGRLTNWVLKLGLIASILCNAVTAEEPPDAHKLAKTIVSTDNERIRVDSAVSLLRLHAAHPEITRELERDPSVALLCQWHDLIDAYDKTDVDRKAPAGMPKHLATRFAPIVKANLGVDPPPEWLELISTARVEANHELYFDVRRYETTCSVFHNTKVVPRALLGTVDVEDPSFLVEIKGDGGASGIDASVIPPTEVKQAIHGLERYGNRWFTGVASEAQVVILLQAPKFEWQQDVFCLKRLVNSNNCQTSWTAQLNSSWGDWVFPYPAGGRLGVSQIRRTATSIYVFTGFYRAVSIVGMDIQSGKQTLLFSHLPASVRNGEQEGK